MLAQVNEDFVVEVVSYIVFIGCGLLFIGLAVPLILRKIPPNRYYGWRTPKAFSSKEIWYEINWYCGRDMLVMGIVQFIYNIVLLCFCTQLDDEVFFQLFLPGNLLILVGGTILMTIRGFLYLRKL